MNTACDEATPLRRHLAGMAKACFLSERGAAVKLTALARGTSLGGRLEALAGRSVLVATGGQLAAALALIELDGHARRLTILPPRVADEHVAGIIAAAEVDAVVMEEGASSIAADEVALRVVCSRSIAPLQRPPVDGLRTEWVLLTSGTTGAPKLVKHDLAGLTGAIKAASAADGAAVWGTFYDIRRYGGLQIFLRALLGGASLVLSSAGEPVAEHLARLAGAGVTHLSGTPSHWRRALMSPALRTIAPRYVRLSGEIADQAILDSLRAVFPFANVGHAYASTEAGVAFDVNDGSAGFPAALFDEVRNGVEMKIVAGSLHIRSPRTALRYVGRDAPPLADAEGFIDTGDMIEQRGERCYFIGRKGGIINVGGLKVHPEEIEAVINRHPRVRMSQVRPRQSPITGAVVVAEVVLKTEPAETERRTVEIKDDILRLCRDALPHHKVPATINLVPSIEMAATGKLTRRHG